MKIAKPFCGADRRTDRERLYLYLYIRMAADLYPAFVEKGISGKVYVDTFYDITIWYNQCVKKKEFRDWWKSGGCPWRFG